MIPLDALKNQLSIILKQVDKAEKEYQKKKTLKATTRIFTVLLLSIFVVATLMVSIWLTFSKLGVFMQIIGGILVIILLGVILQFALICKKSIKK